MVGLDEMSGLIDVKETALTVEPREEILAEFDKLDGLTTDDWDDLADAGLAVRVEAEEVDEMMVLLVSTDPKEVAAA